jgi:hypothetical protein
LLPAAAPVVCCILCVASVPCCALVVEYNASRMLLLVRCTLLVTHESQWCRVFPCCSSHVLASSCMSSAVCCTLSVACVAWFCRLLRGVCCMPHVALLPGCLVACCQWSFLDSTLPVACCMLHVALHDVVVRCILPAAWRMLSGSCLMHAACCQLHFPRCILHAVCYIFPDACCMLSIVCCTFSSGRLRHAVRWIVSACPFFVACRTFSVARGLISVARPTVPCRMPCALSVACPASHLVTLHVA